MSPAKRCTICKSAMAAPRARQKVCGRVCAEALVEKAKRMAEKAAVLADKRQTKAKIDALKSRATLAREAQTVVNRYVRLRDAALGCVSCDKPASWPGQWHASHFRSVGAAPGLRFHLWNIHKACSVCNNHLSGNLAGYTPGLASKIGAARVEWLYSQNAVIRPGAGYFERVKRIFAKKAKRLEKRNQS